MYRSFFKPFLDRTLRADWLKEDPDLLEFARQDDWTSSDTLPFRSSSSAEIPVTKFDFNPKSEVLVGAR